MLTYLTLLLSLRHRDQRGASAVEYGLMLTGVAAVIVSAVFLFGESVSNLFGDTCDTIGTQMTADCG